MNSELDIGISIVIPTYNRMEKLKSRISELLPQMSQLDTLLISDNATELFDDDLLNLPYNDSRVVIHRNKVNIGANANIAKCFELVTGNWMWLLSDDDCVKPNALNIIKKCINKGNADFINFSSELLKTKRTDLICESFDGYLDSIGNNFSNHLLISNNVFNMEVLRPFTKFTYWGCFVNAPHLAPVYCALENNARILLSSETVVEWQKPDRTECWQLSSAFNLLFLPDVLSSSRFRRRAMHVIMDGLSIPEFLIAQLAFNKLEDPTCIDKVNAYADRVMNIYIKYGSPRRKIRAILLKLMLRLPRIYLFFVDFACKKLYGKPISDFLQKRKFEFFL
ncbi:glycosyltransferase [Yersinia intermedia]|nr:glycosyltransferase [Yersinia intermedia]